VFHTNTLTKNISIRPIVKVIGNREYYVESFFNEEAEMDLTDKVKQLIENDVKRETTTLLFKDSKVTSHNPSPMGYHKESEEK